MESGFTSKVATTAVVCLNEGSAIPFGLSLFLQFPSGRENLPRTQILIALTPGLASELARLLCLYSRDLVRVYNYLSTVFASIRQIKPQLAQPDQLTRKFARFLDLSPEIIRPKPPWPALSV